jgi:hypothetical protein
MRDWRYSVSSINAVYGKTAPVVNSTFREFSKCGIERQAVFQVISDRFLDERRQILRRAGRGVRAQNESK